jgi:hypothetical protein
MSPRLRLLRAVAAVASLLAAAGAQACSCARESVEEAVQRAEDIALVRISAVHEVVPRAVDLDAAPSPDRQLTQRAQFKLLRSIKGNLARHGELHAGGGGGDCGMPLLVGMSYVLFSSGETAQINYCQGFFGPFLTQERGEADAQLKVFLDGLEKTLREQSPLPRPPQIWRALEDSSSRWFGPPPPPPGMD